VLVPPPVAAGLDVVDVIVLAIGVPAVVAMVLVLLRVVPGARDQSDLQRVRGGGLLTFTVGYLLKIVIGPDTVGSVFVVVGLATVVVTLVLGWRRDEFSSRRGR
jgi:hypothetical protein